MQPFVIVIDRIGIGEDLLYLPTLSQSVTVCIRRVLLSDPFRHKCPCNNSQPYRNVMSRDLSEAGRITHGGIHKTIALVCVRTR